MSSSKKEIEGLKIPLEEIKLATANFSVENYIGGGGFGKVYRGKLPDSRWQRPVAIKQLNPDGWQGNHEFWNEVSMLCNYKHKNIVAFVGYCNEGNELIIVSEYAANGSLDIHICDKEKMCRMTWEQRLKVCIGAAEGLNHLHSGLGDHLRVIHRDVKSANILLDENLEAKISDFGLSKFGPKNQPFTHLNTRVAGTDGYCDPHYYRTGMLTKESDVYSLGVVLFEILSGRLVFPKKKHAEGGGDDDDDSQSLVALVDRYKDTLDQLIDPRIRDQIDLKSFGLFTEIAYQCLEMDYLKRPKMTTIVKKLKAALDFQGDRSDEPPTPNNVIVPSHVPDIVTDEFFEQILEKSHPRCPGRGFYTRAAFLEALGYYPEFGRGGTEDDSRREIAAFFAHVTHATGHFYSVQETNAPSLEYYCDRRYPCNPNKSYHGRGPIRLSWNYNYVAAGQSIGFDGLNNPDIVATDPVISFRTAFWYWMLNVHFIMISGQGFGATIQAIKGESEGANPAVVTPCVQYYIEYCNQFGVSPGDNRGC